MGWPGDAATERGGARRMTWVVLGLTVLLAVVVMGGLFCLDRIGGDQ